MNLQNEVYAVKNSENIDKILYEIAGVTEIKERSLPQSLTKRRSYIPTFNINIFKLFIKRIPSSSFKALASFRDTSEEFAQILSVSRSIILIIKMSKSLSISIFHLKNL